MPEIRLSTKQFQSYQAELALATRKYDAEAKPVIERMHRYFRGTHWPKVAPQSQTTGVPPLVANLIFADIKVMLPSLALRNPRVFVKPTRATTTTPDGKPAILVPGPEGAVAVPILEVARAKESVINWRWRELKINRQIRRALVDSLLAPFGIIKIGYTLTTEKVALSKSDAEQLEVNELIRAESPFAVRWPPTEIRVDPECRYPDLSDAAWLAFGWKARPEDLKRNPRFMNTGKLKGTVAVKTSYEGPEPTAPDLRTTPGVHPQLEEEDTARVQCWEVWDKRRHKRLVLADDHDKALEYVDWPDAYAGIENFPAETIVFTETPDVLYGYPDLWHVLWQQDGYNELRAMQANHVKRFLRKYLALRGRIDEDKEMPKLTAPIDGIVVFVDGDDARTAVTPLADAPIPADLYQTAINQRDDHDRISGLSDFLRGVAEKVDTATEAEYIQANVSVRVNDSRDVVEDLAARVSRQLLQIDGKTLDVPAVVPLIGPDGVVALNQFLTVASREVLQAEADVTVQVGSMQPISEQKRKRAALEIYNLLRNDPLIDQFALRRMLVPIYQDDIPEIDRLPLTKEEFQQVARQMQQAAPQGGGAEGAPPGMPATPMMEGSA